MTAALLDRLLDATERQGRWAKVVIDAGVDERLPHTQLTKRWPSRCTLSSVAS